MCYVPRLTSDRDLVRGWSRLEERINGNEGGRFSARPSFRSSDTARIGIRCLRRTFALCSTPHVKQEYIYISFFYQEYVYFPLHQPSLSRPALSRECIFVEIKRRGNRKWIRQGSTRGKSTPSLRSERNRFFGDGLSAPFRSTVARLTPSPHGADRKARQPSVCQAVGLQRNSVMPARNRSEES